MAEAPPVPPLGDEVPGRGVCDMEWAPVAPFVEACF